MSKVIKKITKPIRKIIPKEIRPILPIAAAFLPIPGMGAIGSALAKTQLNPLVQAAIKRGIVSAGVQGITEGEVDPFKTAVAGLAGGLSETGASGLPAVLQKTPAVAEMSEGAYMAPSFLEKVGGAVQTGATKVAEAAAKSPFKTATAASGIIATKEAADLAQQKLDEYNASLGASGIEDLGERRDLITRYMTNAGFDESQIQSALTRYGYLANGGRVGYQMGGDVSYTDFERSGVIYRDPQGNPISKEEFLSQTDEQNGIPSIRMKDRELTREDVLQMYADSDQAIKLLEKMVKEGKVSQADYDRMMRIERDMGELENLPYSKYADKEELEQAEKDMMQRDRRLTDLDQELYMILENPKEVEKMLKNRQDMKDGGLTSVKSMSRKKLMDALNSMELPEINASDYDSDQIRDILLDQAPDLFKMKDGGIMNLKGKEMDLRGGGFVPIGKKERADDVPARLSKNEFVFTADAVRAAGGGSVDKGAQRMYNTMKMLEGKLA